MYKLLNRFAWLISLGMGYLITFFMFMGFDELDGRYSTALDDDMFFVWIFFILLFGSISKRLFLSKDFILDRLHYFKDTLLKENSEEVLKITDKSGQELEEDNVIRKDEGRIEKDLNDVRGGNYIELLNNNLSTSVLNHSKSISDFKLNIEDKFGDSIEKIEEKTSKISSVIKGFFAENLMAKVGGILLFLGALFFLQLIYTAIGNVGKLIIGFLFGFTLIGVGIFLDKKKFVGESRIVLGIGFLVNYLVILSGRYLLGTDVSPFLSEGLTFILLVLNTIFAVVTSLVYKSNTLLIFSFIFAYLNPFLVGGSSDSPYTLSIYSMVVSLGALFLSLKLKQESVGKILLLGSVVFGNLLFLVAPFSTELQWIVKVGFMVVLSLISFFIASKFENKNYLGIIVTIGYLFLLAVFVYGGVEIGNLFTNSLSTIVVFISFIALSVLSVVSIMFSSFYLFILLLLVPFVVLLVLLMFGFNIGYLIYLILPLVFIPVVGFAMVGPKLAGFTKYLFWGVFAVLLTIINGFFIDSYQMTYDQSFLLIVSSLLFMFAVYYFATKKDNQVLYAIGSFFTAIMLSLLIAIKGDLLIASVVAIVAYFIANISLPLISKNLVKGNLQNLTFGVVIGILFIGFSVYRYGEIYFPGVSLGFAFLALAVVYFIVSFLLFNKLKPELREPKTKESAQNAVYAILAGSISLLSLAVTYIFAKHGEVIATTWLLEAAVLFYFYSKNQNSKIYIGAMILFVIGIVKLADSTSGISSGEYLSLIPLLIIGGILLVSIRFIQGSDETKEVLYSIFHIIGIFVLGASIAQIFTFHHHGFGFLSVSILVALLLNYYAKLKLNYFWTMFSFVFVFVLLVHLFVIDNIFSSVVYDGLAQYKIFQYIATAILGVGLYFASKTKKLPTIAYIAFALYLLVITSYYVYDLFNNTFAITIYWGVLSAIALIKGIDKDIIKFRTIGLYLLILTVGKIVLFDIWYSLDNAIVRVLALMIVGALMIYISTLYSKKYDGNLKGELDVKNLQ